MPPSTRQAHAELQVEQAALQAEAAQLEADLTALNAALADAEGELGRSPIKQRALELQARMKQTAALPARSHNLCCVQQLLCVPPAQAYTLALCRITCLQEQVQILDEQQRALAATEESTRTPPDQQRDALLARVKRDNAAAEAAAAQVRALQEEVRRLEAAAAAHGALPATALVRDEAEEASRRCVHSCRTCQCSSGQPAHYMTRTCTYCCCCCCCTTGCRCMHIT